MRTNCISVDIHDFHVWGNKVLISLAVSLVLSAQPAKGSESKPRIEVIGKERRLVLPEKMKKALSDFDESFSVDGLNNFADSDLGVYKFTDRQIPYAVIGDFNGDGKEDVIVMGRGKTKRYVVAVMSSKDSYNVVNVKKPIAKLKDGQKNLGYLTLVERGSSVTDYTGESEKKVKTDAVEVVYGETASQTFYFLNGKFESVITSD